MTRDPRAAEGTTYTLGNDATGVDKWAISPLTTPMRMRERMPMHPRRTQEQRPNRTLGKARKGRFTLT